VSDIDISTYMRARGGWQVVLTAEGEVHVVPVGEEHSRTTLCWCKPTHDGGAVYVHHARDRREYTVERQ
jgi:hypothetical protein